MSDKKLANGELSLIGQHTVVEGKIHAEGSIRIDGKLIGDVITKSNAAVGLAGTVEGNLGAKNITVAGKVIGTIVASEKLVLEGKSVVKGEIKASRLVIDEGAAFDGQCSMSVDKSSTAAKEAAHRKP